MIEQVTRRFCSWCGDPLAGEREAAAVPSRPDGAQSGDEDSEE